MQSCSQENCFWRDIHVFLEVKRFETRNVTRSGASKIPLERRADSHPRQVRWCPSTCLGTATELFFSQRCGLGNPQFWGTNGPIFHTNQKPPKLLHKGLAFGNCPVKIEIGKLKEAGTKCTGKLHLRSPLCYMTQCEKALPTGLFETPFYPLNHPNNG